MDFEDILGGVFPVQKFTTDAASQGMLGVLPQAMTGMSEGQQQGLMGLLGANFLGSKGDQQPQQDPYASWQPNQFLSQGGMQTGQMSPAQGQDMDPLSLLDQNINRRFGI